MRKLGHNHSNLRMRIWLGNLQLIFHDGSRWCNSWNFWFQFETWLPIFIAYLVSMFSILFRNLRLLVVAAHLCRNLFNDSFAVSHCWRDRNGSSFRVEMVIESAFLLIFFLTVSSCHTWTRSLPPAAVFTLSYHNLNSFPELRWKVVT